MPFVNVKLPSGATAEQKEKLIAGVTEPLVQVLNKNPATTHVVIEDVLPENWGIRGRTVAALRAAGDPGISRG